MNSERSAENKPERFSKAEIFEHLFPGNKLERLPKINGRVELKILWVIWNEENDYRNAKIIAATRSKRLYLERENILFDEIAANYFLDNLTPTEKVTHPSFYKNFSFVDVLDIQNGEKLGGAATRQIDTNNERWINAAIRLGIDAAVPGVFENVLGILDKNNHPAGIIHFVEGFDKGKRKKVREKIVVKKLVGVPGTSI